MSVIKVNRVSKIYQDHGVPVTALKNISFEVEKGDFISIVGPSGSGKTTLLNIIGGLDNASSGSVIIGDVTITDMKPSRLIDFRLNNIGFVFQAFNLVPVLTARENVEFIMLLQKKPKAERESIANNLLAAVGLEDQMDRRPQELSGGQQQRVAVARALASSPSFVLADEPTANLDSAAAENLLDMMEKMNVDRNMTFIFSTHDPRVVKRAKRVITLEDGKLKLDERINKK